MEQPIICVLLASIAIIFNCNGMEANPCELDEQHQDKLDFMVKLLASNNGQIQDLSCTGFAITNSWVLAPASCLSDPQFSEYKVNTTNGNKKDIKRIIIHEDYNNERGAGYDLALVELSSGLGTSSLTLTPKDKFESVNKTCKLVKQSKNPPGTLLVQSIEPHDLNDTDCLGRFGNSIDQNLFQVTECYGSNTKSAGVCRGETGAVVLCSLVTDKCPETEYFPVALASWGDLVCTPTQFEFFSIFTKLNYLLYHDWIENTIKPSE